MPVAMSAAFMAFWGSVIFLLAKFSLINSCLYATAEFARADALWFAADANALFVLLNACTPAPSTLSTFVEAPPGVDASCFAESMGLSPANFISFIARWYALLDILSWNAICSLARRMFCSLALRCPRAPKRPPRRDAPAPSAAPIGNAIRSDLPCQVLRKVALVLRSSC